MVSFELTEEERMVQKVVHDFAAKEIRPVAHHYDETEEFPYDLVKRAAEIGITGGGLAGGPDSYLIPAIIAEELCWGCAGIALAIMGSGLAAGAIGALATPEQRATWLPKLTATPTEARLGAMCLTEPEAGSDVAGIQTTAVRDGDEWVINGRKIFITNGGIADVHVVFATEDRSKGWGGLAGFVVEKGTPGLSQGQKFKKMGIRASHTAEVIFDNVRIPLDQKLGYRPGGSDGSGGAGEGPGQGALGALRMLEGSRPIIGAQAVGVARAAYEYAAEYATQRVQFGRPIIANQGVAFKLADMAMNIDAARLLVWRALWMNRTGVPFLTGEGSMAKCFAADVAMNVTVDAVQILGGYGYIRETPVEKWMRDAKIFQIFEGTNEIQRLVISRAIGARFKQ